MDTSPEARRPASMLAGIEALKWIANVQKG